MAQFIVNPKPFLADLTGKTVRVKLKWGMEYEGVLTSVDSYMNVHLESTQEYVDGQFAGFLGEVLIRCNNILYIKAAPPPDDDDEEDEKGKASEKMEE
ncbi:Small nuclear ribonucleoprotein F [Seminavis robusta]|uniref:Sm protein F n=1 Tax=Seminavis robusta TaxID=568900 RepID=A0A9N8D7B7_9STRA|nr:Small nuclear ribonucleoprotein F [Seminavis robusta]|eukprot:Sro25_g016910.1 Small nuclear ribonucleoprotein F (98) ;mRNA; f:66514-66969